jgi:hypothetical protein
MATAVENLTTARDNYAAILAEISATPKPTYSVHGHSYSWTEYQRFLMDKMGELNALIGTMEPACEVASQAIT